MEWEVADEF